MLASGVRVNVSSSSQLVDLRALLDSYAVEVWENGLLYFRTPLHFCRWGAMEPPPLESLEFFPAINPGIDVRLVRYEPPVGDEDFLAPIRVRCTRWPFYVEHPLEICLIVGDQWWSYKFSPGEKYEEHIMQVERPK